MGLAKDKDRPDRTVHVKLVDLPNFKDLNREVQTVVARSSWWERYGWDWLIMAVFVGLIPVGFYLLASERMPVILCGMFVMGCVHAVLSVKGSHLALHGALAESCPWNQFWASVFVVLCGSCAMEPAYEGHIKSHHGHTNIIGRGDSASMKVPSLPRYVYMFLAPLLVPVLTPLVSVKQQLERGQVKEAIQCLPLIILGLYGNATVLVYCCGYSWASAVFVMLASRALLTIPYVHVTIFQHIGLPMYSQEHRPQRIYQMSTSVLNLNRNIILDLCFGHSIISCHVEHHLFPKLSDNMCLKVKPVVAKFLRANGLKYNEDTYLNLMTIFVDKYPELMVHEPPVTHFVGIL